MGSWQKDGEGGWQQGGEVARGWVGMERRLDEEVFGGRTGWVVGWGLMCFDSWARHLCVGISVFLVGRWLAAGCGVGWLTVG